MSNTRTTNIRFNLDDEKHRHAWQLLQDRDKKEFPSYSSAVVKALILLFDESERNRRDWAAMDEHVTALISEAVERAVADAVERTLPPFLAGYMACAGSMNPAMIADHKLLPGEDKTEDVSESEGFIDEDIDFDFLGEG